MATWHKAADALLDSDIPALAASVGRHTHTCRRGEDLGAAMAAAVAATTEGASAGAGRSRVATLIVPHDLAWEREGTAPGYGAGTCIDGSGSSQAAAAANEVSALHLSEQQLPPGAQRFVREAAAALRACPAGKAALYIGGRAALAEGGQAAACASKDTPQPIQQTVSVPLPADVHTCSPRPASPPVCSSPRAGPLAYPCSQAARC